MILNEFDAIGSDGDLVVGAGEEVFEMNSGCVCCTVRGDLLRIVGDLLRRQDGHGDRLDGIVVETIGLARPAPVAQTFFMDPAVNARTRPDAIVIVADARQLAAGGEAEA